MTRTTEFTVERNPMYASNVGKPLVLPVTTKHMKEVTQERSSLHVSNMEKP
jgi:hypothetical protein